MDFAYDETQAAIADLARKLFKERVTPASLRTIEAEPDRLDRALWREMAKLDLLGTAQHGLLATCALLVEQGAAVAPIPLWPSLVLGAMPVARFGSEDQKRRLATGVAAGDLFLTAALEGGEAKARRKDGAWRLDGVKLHVPAAHVAKRVLIPAQVEDDGTAVFLLDPRTHGVTLERRVLTTGEPWFAVKMDGARVEDDDVLGDVERGKDIVAWLTPRATIGLCALSLGVAQRALRMTAEYTTGRAQFDRPIATFQAVAQRAADAYVDVEAIRVATWQAAWRLANDLPAAREVAIAKFWACEGGHRVTYAAQHLHGGMGFDVEYPLHRYYLWAKQIELTLGSASEQLAALGADLAAGQ